MGEYETKQVNMGGKVGKIAKAHLCLFNDALLICNPKSKDKYKVVEEVPVDAEVTVQDIPDSKDTKGKLQFFNGLIFILSGTIELATPKQKYMITMNSPEEKKPLLFSLSKVVEDHNNKVKGSKCSTHFQK